MFLSVPTSMFNLNNISDERQQQQQVVIALYFVIQILTI